MAKTAKGTGEDNRQKIIDAAMSIIGEQGVDKTSLAKISKASGLSKGTLYYYYASKNDLIFDIADIHMERISTDLFAMLENETALSWESLLTAFFETLLTSEARSRLHLYLIREAVSGNDSLKKRFQKTYSQWFSMVDQAQSQMPGPQTDQTDQINQVDQVDQVDVSAKSRFLVALVDGFILQVLLETKKTSVQQIVRIVLKALEVV